MINIPKCYERQCIYFFGVKQPDGTELTERIICLAFPEGIPNEIAYGNNKHLVPYQGQANTIVFEEE